MIQHINEHRHANVITIEDPIEFLHRDINCHINQREVGTDTATFGAGAAPRAASGSGRHPDRRDSRSGDAGHGAQGRRHRPPRVLARCTRRTPRRRSIACCRSTRRTSRPRCASRSPARSQAVVSLRLVPRADKPGRVPACEVLINTADGARPDPRHGQDAQHSGPHQGGRRSQYGMQSFDQSLMSYYSRGDHLVRERRVLRHEPQRVRAARAGRGRNQRHELVRLRDRLHRLSAHRCSRIRISSPPQVGDPAHRTCSRKF